MHSFIAVHENADSNLLPHKIFNTIHAKIESAVLPDKIKYAV